MVLYMCVSKLTSSSNSVDSLEDNVSTVTRSILYTSCPPGKEPSRVLLDITNSLQSAPAKYQVISAWIVQYKKHRMLRYRSDSLKLNYCKHKNVQVLNTC